MEKVKVDTEVRKLDALRASHVNQQHNFRWNIKSLPEHIETGKLFHAALSDDIKTRDSHKDEEFSMKVENRFFSGKGAREEAGKALNEVVMSWKDDQSMKVRATYKGFDIASRGSKFKDTAPDLYLKGKALHRANLNPESPLGTMASIEHVLRSLDDRAASEQKEIDRQKSSFADYTTQLGKPFEHEDRLKELMSRQAELNKLLDLDKHEAQVVAEVAEKEPKVVGQGFAGRVRAKLREVQIAP